MISVSPDHQSKPSLTSEAIKSAPFRIVILHTCCEFPHYLTQFKFCIFPLYFWALCLVCVKSSLKFSMLSISLAFVVPDIGSFFLCFFCFSASVSLDSAQDRILPPNMDAVEQAVLWQEWVVILKQHQHWLREELNKWNNTLAKWDRWEEERARPQGRDLLSSQPALLRTSPPILPCWGHCSAPLLHWRRHSVVFVSKTMGLISQLEPSMFIHNSFTGTFIKEMCWL